jgi:antitoxin CptB
MRCSDSKSDFNRLRWQCRRGMLELDLTLSRFLENEYSHLPTHLQAGFRALLELSDPDLWNAICGGAEPQDEDMVSVLAMLRGLKSDTV